MWEIFREKNSGGSPPTKPIGLPSIGRTNSLGPSEPHPPTELKPPTFGFNIHPWKTNMSPEVKGLFQ